MNNNEKKMIATIVKERRRILGYTQQEVSDISNISLRSIQRIENGKVEPRMYTLKALSKSLNFSLDDLTLEETKLKDKLQMYRRIILSVISSLVIGLLSAAFITQSNGFPETTFELLIYCTVIVAIIGAILLKIWKSK